MTFRKAAVRAAAALTMLAFAAPALPCGDMQQTHATTQAAPAGATAATAPSATPKDAVAKQDKAKGARKTESTKKTTATN